ncbi:Histone-lysine N-methyltransferase SETMAR [Eumeta japonica]|uniref:Histone-lysine N-methyltransferase SETMAR n=1 Tax=Eumeta variegata TaxID=151549 RepID=A0A4C1V755_EUMVA|nr:Histone-lysine N-methyltransferase SETMAR [Eumeta japonica]
MMSKLNPALVDLIKLILFWKKQIKISILAPTTLLKSLELTTKQFSYELYERNQMNRILIWYSLLKRNKTEPFLKRLITGDEKWITYDKNKRNRSCSKSKQAVQIVTKSGLTRNKLMLYVS